MCIGNLPKKTIGPDLILQSKVSYLIIVTKPINQDSHLLQSWSMIQWSIHCSYVNMMKLSVTSWKLPETMKDDGWLSRMKSDPTNYSSVVWRNIRCYSSSKLPHPWWITRFKANIGCVRTFASFRSIFLLISVHISYFDGEKHQNTYKNSTLKLQDFSTKPIKYLISPG